MAYTSRLEIIIDSVTGERRLRRLRGELGRTERAGRGVGSALKAAILPLAGLISVAAAGRKLVEVSRQFDVINASLVTATGSAEGATTAFQAIQDFAATTPYALQEVANAFIKLRNMGLDPSEAALESYGNSAAAMGKSLNQMIEAVADAATGEFERLKEFGIRAASEGDQVKFTFQGVTTTVKKEADAIEGYLRQLGDVNFAGAMDERAATLDGALSNLGDSWNSLFLTVSNQGAGGLIEENVRRAEAAIVSLTEALASGQIAGYLDAIGNRFEWLVDDSISAFNIINQMLSKSFGGWAEEGEGAVEHIVEAFLNAPENIRAFFQIMGAELEALDRKFSAYADAFGEYLNPANWFADVSTLASGLETQLTNIESDRLAAIFATEQQHKAAIASWKGAWESDIKLADTARAAYQAAQAARANVASDRLAQFGIDVGSEGKPERPTSKELSKMASGPSYDSLLGMVDAQDRGSQIIAAQQAEFEATRQGLDRKYAIEQAHMERMQVLELARRNNKHMTDEQFNALELASDQQKNEQLLQLNGSYWERYLASAEDNLTNFSELTGNMLEGFSSRFGDAFESMIFDAQTFEEAMSGLAEGMLRSVVNALGQMAAQWLAYQAVQLLVGTTTQASAAATQTANAQAMSAMAGLNAFASTAAIPVVGPALAPAAAGAAIAFTQPMAAAVTAFSLAGMAHEGIDNVPREGTWLLDKGERVVGSSLNRDLSQMVDRDKKGERGSAYQPPNVTNVFQISTGVSQTVQSEIRSMLPQINEATQRSVMAAISKGGPMARAVGRK